MDALASASFVLLGFFSVGGGCKRLFSPLREKGVKEMGVPFMSLMRGVFEGYMMRGVAADVTTFDFPHNCSYVRNFLMKLGSADFWKILIFFFSGKQKQQNKFFPPGVFSIKGSLGQSCLSKRVRIR